MGIMGCALQPVLGLDDHGDGGETDRSGEDDKHRGEPRQQLSAARQEHSTHTRNIKHQQDPQSALLQSQSDSVEPVFKEP